MIHEAKAKAIQNTMPVDIVIRSIHNSRHSYVSFFMCGSHLFYQVGQHQTASRLPNVHDGSMLSVHDD